ncbi:VOC family protein [Chthonobacter albigriseus]|uniref:VOC family protein n=1 Tax=Chthonobacter albigriseus TaxID=1683161 RepID=UPI0015EFBC67|nr:VOC family protein [Chthonobacter albigriseus]
MMIALDHVFVFVARDDALPGGKVRQVLDGIGLVPSYERRHTGQGTSNVCYCFDNAYLELLFVVDEAELAAPALARNGFTRRSRLRQTGANPFGIALRGEPFPFESWPYRIDAFPPGLSIPVAVASDDDGVPFVFGSPGTERPDRWTDGRADARQTAGGYTTMTIARIGAERAGPLAALAGLGIADAVVTGAASLVLRLQRGGDSVELELADWV